MIGSDVTLGQYYPSESLLHRLDPRVKLFGTFVFVIVLFMSRGAISYALDAFFVLSTLALSGVPFVKIVKIVGSTLWFIIFIAFFQLFAIDGTPLIRLGFFQITDQGVLRALDLAFRMTCLILGTLVITLCTTPKDLTDGLEKGLGFLKRLRFPVHEMAMSMSIALRFIPVLQEENARIRKAQMSRGADFNEGGPFRRIISLIPLLTPLLLSTFQRAYDLSLAMESRCYNGGDGRTKLHSFCYAKVDRITYCVVVLFFCLILITNSLA
jgi:energy-coupling factor transport system permease protein